MRTRPNFDIDQLARRLSQVAAGQVKANEVLASHTSYRIGGPSALWVAPRTESAVSQVLEIIHASNVPLLVLGRGSNLLISDRGWQGVTLYVGENLSGWHFDGQRAEVRAGTRLIDLIRATVVEGLAGMELMAGIPGGVGGALRMNAGAFGQQIATTTVRVEGFRLDGRFFKVDREQIRFGYRGAPELEQRVVTRGYFRFAAADPTVLQKRMEDTLALRAAKQPLAYPSCGSVFKRPPGYYAGALIEEAGLKGARIGGAMVSSKHAGFIVNVNNATAADVYALIRRIETRVLKRFGVQLEREVRLIGDFED